MRTSSVERKRLTDQLEVRLIEEVRHPDDKCSDDGVLVAGVENLDVEIVGVQVDNQEHEPLFEYRITVVILGPERKINN